MRLQKNNETKKDFLRNIDPFNGGFIIDANGQKSPSDNLFVTYGDDILKPNDETLTEIAEYYETRLFEYFTDLFEG